MASMNEAMRIQLAEKGETIVGDLGMGARLLVKNSDLHTEMMKICKNFAAQENTLNSSIQMFRQLSTVMADVQDKLQHIDTSLQEIPKMCDILKEAEHTSSAINFVPPSPSKAQSIRMVSIDTSPIASPDTRFP